MTDKMAIRTFPTAYKLKAIKRAELVDGLSPCETHRMSQLS